jgi:uncharacterized repeat protein (TIGR02543 family)
VGYLFDGWFDAASGGTAWDFATNAIAAATTIYAQWTVITNAVTFDSQGGSAVAGQVVDYDTTVTEPAAPTREGFTFDGWFDAASGGSAWDFGTDTVTSATTLYAQWTAITYTVTYNAQGGSAVGAETVSSGSLATQPGDPTRTGYTFDGWYTASSGGAAWDFGADTLLADTTLFAQWTAIDYAVTFDSQGGSAVSDVTANYGDLLTEPTGPVLTGYRFDGWFTAPSGGTAWDFATNDVTDNLTLYAYWSELATVTFVSSSDAVPSQSVVVGDFAAEPPAPTRPGYTFAGWFTASTGGEQWTFAADPAMSDVVLYAHWELVAGALATTGDPVMVEVQLAFALFLLGALLLVVGGRRPVRPEARPGR